MQIRITPEPDFPGLVKVELWGWGADPEEEPTWILHCQSAGDWNA
jgi:hypothetical protein